MAAKKKAKKKATKKKATKKKVAKKTTKKKATKKKATKKKVAKKTTKKKATKKKVAKKKVVKAAAPKLVNADKLAKKVKKARTKSDITALLAESTGFSKKEIASVFEQLGHLISLDVGKKGPGVFNMPGLIKIVRVHKPATKARKGINPFTKEPMMFKAKPARNIVRVRPLKALKDSVQ